MLGRAGGCSSMVERELPSFKRGFDSHHPLQTKPERPLSLGARVSMSPNPTDCPCGARRGL